MCGILFTNNPVIEKKLFSDSLSLMYHRGPDIPPAMTIINQFKLGHTRLKIIDLDDRSNQPFFSDDGRYVIIYNGEIYNHRELARQHKLKLRTSGDTEVILKLFLKLGSGMLNLLNGMFSFIILDKETGSFFAARDRLGVKPLYYSYDKGFFIFSSEIAPILNITGNDDQDEIGIRQYRKLRTFFNGRTFYSSIQMFPAAHFMENNKLTRYWSLPLYKKPDPQDDEIAELIKSSVEYRCISDVSVGTYLSGGLDSSIVTSVAAEHLGQIYSWTVGFEEENEFYYSDIAADKFGTIHSKITVTDDEFVRTAEKMILQRGEPLSVPNEVLLYLMTREVKKYNTVVLSGEGADELFFGYDRIFRWASESEWDLKTFSALYSYGSNDDLEIVEDAVSPFVEYGNALDIVAAFFQTAHLHGLLRRLDNATMFNSVEARVPFCDYRLVERMAGVSFSYRLQGGVVKHPLKKIYTSCIPDEIISRKKIGFPVPLDKIKFGPKYIHKGMDNWLAFNLDTLNMQLKAADKGESKK